MAATKDDIGGWFDSGVAKNATYMLVVCDTFDWEDFPIYASPGQDVRKLVDENHGPNMQKVMEVYDLSASKSEQLAAGRVWRLPPA